jgi:hypothetical protein
MAPAHRDDLDNRNSIARDALGVEVGLDIALNYGNAHGTLKLLKGLLENTGFARAGRTDEIQHKDAPFPE